MARAQPTGCHSLWTISSKTPETDSATTPECNIDFFSKCDDKQNHFNLFVYERGAGLTSCCGSGATAARIALEHIGCMSPL